MTNTGGKFMAITVGELLKQDKIPFGKATIGFNRGEHVLLVGLLFYPIVDCHFVFPGSGGEVAAGANECILDC